MLNEEYVSHLVDVESHKEKVDFVSLPAVFLQQFHQHSALFGLLLLFLCSLLLLRGHLHLIIFIVIILVLVFLLGQVLFSKDQLELRIFPKCFWEGKKTPVGVWSHKWKRHRAWTHFCENIKLLSYCYICGCRQQSCPVPRILRVHWWSRWIGAQEWKTGQVAFPRPESQDSHCTAPRCWTGCWSLLHWS